MASHPAYNLIKGGENSKVWMAQAKTSRKQITSRTDLTEGAEDYIQILDISGGGLQGGSIRVVNVYERTPKRGEPRIAQQADWGAIMVALKVVVAGDMNAHSLMWNGRCAKRYNDQFCERLIEDHGLTIHNSEQTTRGAANAICHSIIDLILSGGNVDLRWSIADEDQDTMSDHEILVCRLPR